MPFYWLEPEVAGGWGLNIQVHRGTHPPVVTHMHYEFQGWLGDDLLTTFPEFVVTERLAVALESTTLTGFVLAGIEVSAGGMWETSGRRSWQISWYPRQLSSCFTPSQCHRALCGHGPDESERSHPGNQVHDLETALACSDREPPQPDLLRCPRPRESASESGGSAKALRSFVPEQSPGLASNSGALPRGRGGGDDRTVRKP